MKQRIRPALGLKIREAKHQFILLPFAALSLFILGFIFVPYIEATFRASAAGSDTSLISTKVSDAWARLSTSGNVTIAASSLSSSGTIYSGRADVIAATNSPSGYKLYLSANNSKSTTSLYNSTANADINAMSSTSTASTFSTLNTWGYGAVNTYNGGLDSVSGFSTDYTSNLSSKLFKGATATSQSADGLIAQSNAARSNGSVTKVYYAAYLNSAVAAGTYSADITYTLVADFSPSTTPDVPEDDPSAPDTPTGSESEGDYAYTGPGTGSESSNKYVHYYGSTAGSYYYYNDSGTKVVQALGVNKTEDDTITTIANINDGNITWAAIAIVAGASATFLAIALLRDREDDDEE